MDGCRNAPKHILVPNVESVLRNCQFNPFEDEHIRLAKSIISSNLDNRLLINAFQYIQRPDFKVNAYYYNPVYKPDFYNLSSISQAVIIYKVLSCYFPISNEKIIDAINNPNNNPDIYARLVQCLEVINHNKKTKRNLYDIKGFLDKGLLKLGLKTIKIMIAPGVYMLVEELVPYYTTAFNEIMQKLLSDFRNKNGRTPSPDEHKVLYYEAIRLSCDIELENGKVIKNPHTFYTLADIEEPMKKEIDYFDYVFSNPYVISVSSWQEYKVRAFAIYGIKWHDDYFALGSDKRYIRKNIWTVEDTYYFDNRCDYTLEDQKVLFKK